MNPTISFRHHSLREKSTGTIYCFRNCRLFRNGKFVQPSPPNHQDLWVRDGKVLEPLKIFYEERRRPSMIVDCNGLILSPGFLDIQVNGAFGVDFTRLANGELKDEEIQDKIKYLAVKIIQYGITGFCPTIITTSSDSYKRFLQILNKFESNCKGAALLGAHFEGPFISSEKPGCHPKDKIISDLTGTTMQSIYGEDFSHLSIVTLAPELEGAQQAIQYLVQKGVRVSIGHSNSDLETARMAIKSGASCITHLFSQISTFHHRNPGIIGTLSQPNDDDKQLYYGLISDGLHLADSAIQMAFSANPNGAILVPDCNAALGLGDGIHNIGSQTIEVKGNKAVLKGTDILAGSVSSMNHCVKHFSTCISKLPCRNGLEEALKAVTYNPANFLDIGDQKGTLIAGADADFVLIDNDLNIFATFIGGRKVYEKN